jgi:hypothetical protein
MKAERDYDRQAWVRHKGGRMKKSKKFKRSSYYPVTPNGMPMDPMQAMLAGAGGGMMDPRMQVMLASQPGPMSPYAGGMDPMTRMMLYGGGAGAGKVVFTLFPFCQLMW